MTDTFSVYRVLLLKNLQVKSQVCCLQARTQAHVLLKVAVESQSCTGVSISAMVKARKKREKHLRKHAERRKRSSNFTSHACAPDCPLEPCDSGHGR